MRKINVAASVHCGLDGLRLGPLNYVVFSLSLFLFLPLYLFLHTVHTVGHCHTTSLEAEECVLVGMLEKNPRFSPKLQPPMLRWSRDFVY